MIETRLIEPEKVKEKSKEESELLFPLLVRARRNGAILIFTDVATGTVIISGTLPLSSAFGEHSHHWGRITDTTIWEILPKGYGVAIIQGKVRE